MKQYKFRGRTVSLKPDTYQNNGTLAVIMEQEDGEADVINTNLNSPFQSESMAFLDTNNYPDIEAFIRKNKLGLPMGIQELSGFCKSPLYTLFVPAL